MSTQTLTWQSFLVRVGLCGLLLAGLLILSPGIGSASGTVTWSDAWGAKLGRVFSPEDLAGRSVADLDADGRISQQEATWFGETALRIGFDQRFARSVLALIVGVTLAMCGGAFQVLFRNPLATPYTLGIASGGSLGALIAIRVGWEWSRYGLSSVALASFLGGLAVVALVVLLARGSRRLSSNEILLAGVTLGLFCSAMMMLVTAISDQRQTIRMVRWMMGSLDTVSHLEGATILPLAAPAWIVLLLQARALNQYRLGDELAAARGVSPLKLQLICVLFATVGVAAVVAHCGPVGFVGLVVPHVAALLVGRDARVLLPSAAMLGGAFLIVCDWTSQLCMGWAGWATGKELGGATLPIGVVTALVGVPIFLVLLRWRGR